MTLWLLSAAAFFAVCCAGALFLSTRPILYTRIFVSHDERPLVRREILGNPAYERRMRRLGALHFTIAAGCLVAAYLLK